MDFEFQILDFIRETFSCAPMDAIMKFITFFGNAGWFWIVLSLVLAFIPKTRKIGLTACCALLFSLIFCNLTLKPLIARIRPYDLRDIALIIEAEHDFSFPSGHTSASFAAAVSIFYYNKKWFGISALVFATLIAFSRLYLYVHFPTDILGGIVLGIVCATLAFFTVKFGYKKFAEIKTK
jgi:undecaprenyl-diphosphatase